MSESTEIVLDYPVTVDAERYDRLSMRRWKVADRLRVHRAGGDDADKELRMFADLCGVPVDAILELDGADYEKLVATYRGFSSTAQPKT